MSDLIKIAIADDHILVRQSIALALQTTDKFKVIGQADNGKALLELIRVKKTDVVILDLEMPVMNGWEALELLRKNYPHVKVVVVSMHFDGLFIKDLVEKGARGFLPKNSDFETLINAIHEVNDLGYFFSKKISPNIVKELLTSNTITPMFDDTSLTERELDTLRLVCTDASNREIAARLGVAERTVERYKTFLYEKTKAKTSAGLVLYALKHNIISKE